MGRTTGVWRVAWTCLLSLFFAAVELQTGASQAQAQATPVPDNFLVEPKPVHVDLGLSELFGSPGKRLMRLEGVNATTGPVRLGTPTAGPVLRSGSADTAVATGEEPAFGQNTCVGTIQPKQMCALTLQLPTGIGSGAYSIDVALLGADGGQSLRSVKFEMRSSVWLAGFLIALGVVLGALVTDWRTTGLQATDRRIVAADLRARAQRLAGSATKPRVQHQAVELVRVLRTLDASLIQGDDPGSRLTELEDQLEKLASCEWALIAADKAGETTDAFGTLAADLVGALDMGDWGEIDKELSALRAELVQFPQLIAAAQRLDDELTRLQGAVAILGAGHAAIATEWQNALTEKEGAFKRLPGGADGCVQRATKLDAATVALANKAGALLGALLDTSDAALKAEPADLGAKDTTGKRNLDVLGERLLALRNDGGPVGGRLAKAIALWGEIAAAIPSKPAITAEAVNETASAAAPKSFLPQGTDLKFILGPDAFQPAIGASVTELRTVRKRWNVITDIVVLAGIAATGVLFLWTQNRPGAASRIWWARRWPARRHVWRSATSRYLESRS